MISTPSRISHIVVILLKIIVTNIPPHTAVPHIIIPHINISYIDFALLKLKIIPADNPPHIAIPHIIKSCFVKIFANNSYVEFVSSNVPKTILVVDSYFIYLQFLNISKINFYVFRYNHIYLIDNHTFNL